MKALKKLIKKLIPANTDIDFMDVKEWSERCEMAELQAKEAVMYAMYTRKQWEKRCKQYAEQCRRRKAA